MAYTWTAIKILKLKNYLKVGMAPNRIFEKLGCTVVELNSKLEEIEAQQKEEQKKAEEAKPKPTEISPDAPPSEADLATLNPLQRLFYEAGHHYQESGRYLAMLSTAIHENEIFEIDLADSVREFCAKHKIPFSMYEELAQDLLKDFLVIRRPILIIKKEDESKTETESNDTKPGN